MAAVSDMPDVVGQEVAVCSRHRFSLEDAFLVQKTTSKLLNNAFYATLRC
jgi:hypothetical protein